MDNERLDACEVVRRFGGVAGWNQILRHSSSHSVRRALDAGELRRVARGTYALAELPAPYQAAAAMGGLLSHSSAAQHWKLESLMPAASVHVTVPAHARPRRRRAVVLHYSDVPPDEEIHGATSPLRTVLDCARALPFAEALSIADSALRLAVLDLDELVSAAQALKGRDRRRILRVACAADGRAANPFESGLRAIVLDAGIRGFEPQLPVSLPSRTAWVDLGDPVRRIVLEADSFTYHGTPSALIRDCRRHDELIQLGWLPLRFGWDHVRLEPAWVATVVKDTCALRGRAKRGAYSDRPQPGSV